jgi:hypothetical protein
LLAVPKPADVRLEPKFINAFLDPIRPLKVLAPKYLAWAHSSSNTAYVIWAISPGQRQKPRTTKHR